MLHVLAGYPMSLLEATLFAPTGWLEAPPAAAGFESLRFWSKAHTIVPNLVDERQRLHFLFVRSISHDQAHCPIGP